MQLLDVKRKADTTTNSVCNSFHKFETDSSKNKDESTNLSSLPQPVCHKFVSRRCSGDPGPLYTDQPPEELGFDIAAVHYTHSPPCLEMSEWHIKLRRLKSFTSISTTGIDIFLICQHTEVFGMTKLSGLKEPLFVTKSSVYCESNSVSTWRYGRLTSPLNVLNIYQYSPYSIIWLFVQNGNIGHYWSAPPHKLLPYVWK